LSLVRSRRDGRRDIGANVPFDRDSGEVLIACQRHFVAFPPTIVAEVRARDATGSTRAARYPIPHVFERRAGE
jgi:hypothetical protein